ncbi:Dual specificity mitogen-activated protein kinase kinase 6 [Halotydeus destructor]|nr:Dual specificity mitogen-activated protein kinase kinase 6 [Halotydeus destructor]
MADSGMRRKLKGPKFDFKKVEPPAPVPHSIIPSNLDRKINVTIGNDQIVIDPENLDTVSQLGRGAYGIVERVRHRPSGHELAVKRITMNAEQKKQLMDMDVLDKGAGCPNIVKFYGALFWEGDLWIFMEIMDCSLDKFYKLAFTNASDAIAIPENVLGKIAYSVINALHYLHSIKIIHRDVKPSNILISKKGEVKLCDFGIAGYLVNSLAKTFEAGCKPYMAPERINPAPGNKGYDIRSDVWSLGIAMLEMAIGRFPYDLTGNLFQQLKQICSDQPPRLPTDGNYSSEIQDFIDHCLQKNHEKRPYYSTLLEHPFVKNNKGVDISDFVTLTVEKDT